MNSGYCGYSMSINAKMAYESGEKPLSKWNKKEILNEIIKLLESHNELKTIKKSNEYYYCEIEYEEWVGSRNYGSYKNYKDKGIVIENRFYSFFGSKKKIDGKHILKIENLGNKKPRTFDKKLVKDLKKKLNLI